MNTEQIRAEFEAWAQDKTELYKMSNGDYSSRITRFAFEAYQAGRATLQSQEREDAERLDWLDKVAHCADWVEDEPTKRVIRADDGAEFTGDTWREAIDHARRVERE